MDEPEVWKPVPNSNDVEASNFGRIRQFGKVLEQHGETYQYVVGTHKWGKLTIAVHRLVALAWLTLPDDADVVKYEVNHINERKKDNRPKNLNYLTHSDNIKWGTCPERMSKAKKGVPKSEAQKRNISEAMKGVPKSEAHKRNIGKSHSKPVQQLTLDGKLIATFQSQIEAERQTGIHQGNICQVCKGNLKQTGGFLWRYADE